ncbi:MAG: TIGR04551 family protein [Myxococcota bacterium]|nr:TIGR04551 family protein [Myxococcota bacterium]
MRRRHPHLLLSLALIAPLLLATSSSARAQDPPSTPPLQESAPTPPAVTAPREPIPRPAARPALVEPTPSTSPAPIDPARDQQDLAAQGSQRPVAGELAGAHDVFSDDWWGRARPVIELHGYFRTRGELFHDFFLGRHGSTVQGANGDSAYLFPIPLDQSYTQTNGNSGQDVRHCGPAAVPNQPCYDKTETSANLRLRLDPEIHISDNLRIVTQLNLLDNLVLGSTPSSYAMRPASSSSGATTTSSANGYQSAGANPYSPIGLLATTQGPPTAGVNSWTNSINVTRVWGEYQTPVGQVRFGRMPGHWGLGMVENSGDGVDSDYQTTLDRIMFVTGLKAVDLYFGAAWDFPSTGPTNASAFDAYGGQPYNTCNLCNVNEWAAFIAHRTNPEIQRLMLARGDVVVNGGLYAVFRSQYLDVAPAQTPSTTDFSSSSNTNALEARQAWTLVPDIWVQALWQKLRVEAELATVQGQIGYLTGVNQDVTNPIGVRQYGLVTQTEFRAIDDKLDLQFGFGWSSGDRWASSLAAPTTGLRREENGSGPISTFQFHPDYRVDLIFYRHILSRVEGSYYFRPSVDYDFVRRSNGERLGGGAAIIWSRASEFIQAPGHARDLGVELDVQLYYQSKDGSLNDDPHKIGGFYTMAQYGVFFPLAGLGYLPGGVQSGFDTSLSAAQTARLFLGIVF